MRVGVPRETMEAEHRVALAPSGAREIAQLGHDVLIEQGAGAESGFPDESYERAGARIVTTDDAWSADLVCKVKEPLAPEFRFLRPELTLFTYLHLAAHRELTLALIESGCIAIAYETVATPDGRLPLLAPMSEIAGRMAPHVAAHYLEAEHGVGMLLGGVPGVRPARVVVLGAGVAGRNAAALAAGLEAEVILFDKNLDRLREVDAIFHGRIVTVYSTREAVEETVIGADVVVGAVLVPGARAPIVVTEEMVERMQPGRVVIDISIDQGGCIATSHPTTHHEPVFTKHGVVHYCVGNIPGAVPHTSTHALTHATLPYIEAIVSHGVDEAIRTNPQIVAGVNVAHGKVTNEGVARAHGLSLERL